MSVIVIDPYGDLINILNVDKYLKRKTFNNPLCTIRNELFDTIKGFNYLTIRRERYLYTNQYTHDYF